MVGRAQGIAHHQVTVSPPALRGCSAHGAPSVVAGQHARRALRAQRVTAPGHPDAQPRGVRQADGALVRRADKHERLANTGAALHAQLSARVQMVARHELCAAHGRVGAALRQALWRPAPDRGAGALPTAGALVRPAHAQDGQAHSYAAATFSPI